MDDLHGSDHWWSLLIIRGGAAPASAASANSRASSAWAKNILAARLRALVDHGILAHAPASDGSAYQEYVLTPKGRGTFHPGGLRQWSEAFDDRPRRSRPFLSIATKAARCESSSCARRRRLPHAERYDAEATAGRTADGRPDRRSNPSPSS